MSDCLFCRIVAGEVPSTKVFENERILAFEDILPQAPTHILVVPKKHYVNVHDA
ncbi:MAG: HIT domain-containing protein, partial [Acidobacteriota bacterium]